MGAINIFSSQKIQTTHTKFSAKHIIYTKITPTICSEKLERVDKTLLDYSVPAQVDPTPTPLIALKYHYVVVLLADFGIETTVLNVSVLSARPVRVI